MKAYLIDEISASDIEKIASFLSENSIRSRLGSIFWVKIPADLLAGDQHEHKDCQPYAFGVEMGDNWFKAEFFIRTLEGMGCDCQNYATPQQREFIINFSHSMLETLGVRT